MQTNAFTANPRAPRGASFDPLVDQNTRILVLGTMPGELSLATGRYYADPRNQFWQLIGAVIGAEIELLSYERRTAALMAAGIGLWDVLALAERQGSLDAAIRKPVANNLVGLASALRRLALIAFNGRKPSIYAARLVGRSMQWPTVTLLSSSGACARKPEVKLANWLVLQQHLAS